MTKLSEHFSLNEFTVSATLDSYNECPGVTEYIPNTPSRAEIEWMRYLCVKVLEPLRKELGKPVYINSGFRCSFLNELLHGAPNSQHMCGQAADIRVADSKTGMKIFSILKHNKFVDQALYEYNSRATWIHVSVSPTPRQIFIDKYPAK